MVKVSQETIIAAFKAVADHARYARWLDTFQRTLGLYAHAEEAFMPGTGHIEDFKPVYESLRRHSQAFRGVATYWNAPQVYSQLLRLNGRLRGLSLSCVKDNQWSDVWATVYAMREIKETRKGPSLVAISKFLHFWNPRLFVIFDAAVMEDYIFRHAWLMRDLPEADRVRRLCHIANSDVHGVERLITYMRVLIFASEFMQCNPHVLSAFSQTAHDCAGNAAFPDAVERYEAVAVEWCLQGLVELHPAGVRA